MEGDASGTLTLDFGVDVSAVTFGFALNCGPSVVDAATAQALDADGMPVGSPVSADGLDFGSFAENQLTVSPGSSFRSMQVTFAGDQVCPRFAFDNLVYDGEPVPALPYAWRLGLVLLLIGIGLSALSWRRI
jgi:hypothetical protein